MSEQFEISKSMEIAKERELFVMEQEGSCSAEFPQGCIIPEPQREK